jgi:uncharacterized lipoprotein YmbA
MRRRPWLVAVALLLGACAMAEDSRSAAFLKDARECEMDADAQLKTVSEADQGIRMLLLQSCMALRGWPQ